ncbi:MAG: TrmB family transcriptional regulator [Lachnospiraceae bacterium]|nr:TrmB family transcriptional regulator [Lachnospiraceae bacterium]MBQ3545472.1 TrmB family transcriptional regulator [Lachnospiraceae bacterium]
MDELVISLEGLGFSTLECKIYLSLLDYGAMSPYQIAKKVDISRSSIYNALEHMVNKGMVEIVPEDTVMYIAQDPEILINKLEGDYKKNINNASVGLKRYLETRYEEKYAILNDRDIILQKAGKMIREAKQEIFINTDMDLNELLQDLKIAVNNNVRIIVFSFVKQECNCQGVEIYSHNRERNEKNTNHRLMLVADDDLVLIADNSTGREKWTGTVSNNRLMKSIVREHIHNDIYILKIRDIYGKEIYDNIHINTLLETKKF